MTGPLVFAHRGASAELPEHTLAAYERAIDQGADGVECDVRLTRDGHLVCIHDRRLNRTSDGRGRVSQATLAELQQLDFTSWHHANQGSEPLADTGVLTLEQLLATAGAAGRDLRVLVETKHPSRYGPAVEQRLVELLSREGLLGAGGPVSVTVMSFSALAVSRLRRLAPALETVLLLDVGAGVRAGRHSYGAGIVGPGIAAVRASPDLVARAHDRGRQVYVWTVNDDADIDLVLSLGVDGIISDRPAHVLARLGR